VSNLPEIQFYWNLMQAINGLRCADGRVKNVALLGELIDELTVMHLMSECQTIRKLTATALARFDPVRSGVACS
jgi:hypothetical protein